MRKVIIILLLFTSSRTIISCCKELGFSFRWSKAIVTNIKFSNNQPSLLTDDSSKIENYGFRLTFDYEQVTHLINELGFNETYAFKCEAIYKNKDSVTSIDVLTQNNFDNTHPAGSSIAAYVLAAPGSPHFDVLPYQFQPISSNLYYINPDNSINHNILDFKFKNITPFPGQHKFIVIVSFKSGRTLSGSISIKFY